ncbi:hypothetical protein B7463_g6186, partial [Scytalidium lignicola]
MTRTTTADSSLDTAPKMHSPVTWDIRGWQNNWNWKLSQEVNKIEYQTRFPAEHLALDAQIIFPSANGSEIAAKKSIMMENIANEGFSNKWPVKVRALGDRELHWEYEHPVFGDRSMYLIDPATKEILGDANDNYLALHQELPKMAVEELVITGTAAQILLAPFMHNDMSIATCGPEGRGQWKYQDPN